MDSREPRGEDALEAEANWALIQADPDFAKSLGLIFDRFQLGILRYKPVGGRAFWFIPEGVSATFQHSQLVSCSRTPEEP